MTEIGYWLTPRECDRVLRERLREATPRRIQLLTGPRQVGKTTLLLALAEEFGAHALFVAADAPEASLPGFWERLWMRAEDVARSEGSAVILLDEVHMLSDWAKRLKAEWDRLLRRKSKVHVVATGSSALRLASGSRESLAGRFERITLSHWSASSAADAFGLTTDKAAELVVRAGAYPGAFPLLKDSRRWAAYVHDAILEPAIGRDILALGPVRKPALLRQVFAVCAGSPAQIVSLQKIQGQLQDAGALETIAHYLELLEQAFLVAPLQKYSIQPVRRRSAPPKLVVLSNALLAVASPLGSPDVESDPARFGHWLENACLAHAWNAGQRVLYWREEPLEVDGVIEGSWGRWAIEIKSGDVQMAELRGLLEFHRRFPEFRPVLVGTKSARGVAERAGVEFVEWHDYLSSGLGSRTS